MTDINNNFLAFNISMFKKITLNDQLIYLSSNCDKCKDDRYALLHLHQDEITSLYVMIDFSNQHQNIQYNYLHQSDPSIRNINLKYNNKIIEVDPNRIYTEIGRQKILDEHSVAHDAQLAEYINNLANFILDQISHNKIIVSLHNNFNAKNGHTYNFATYLTDYDKPAPGTLAINVADKNNMGDFVLVSRQLLFDELKKYDINLALQDNKSIEDDGSLSVYCGQNDIDYINIETERGHYEEQLAILNIIHGIL